MVEQEPAFDPEEKNEFFVDSIIRTDEVDEMRFYRVGIPRELIEGLLFGEFKLADHSTIPLLYREYDIREMNHRVVNLTGIWVRLLGLPKDLKGKGWVEKHDNKGTPKPFR